MNFSWVLLAVVFLAFAHDCGVAGLTSNQANGGRGDNHGLGGDGGHVKNIGLPVAYRVVRATPVDSPLTRTKRCDNVGIPCGVAGFSSLTSNQANGGSGDNQGIGGDGGRVENVGVPVAYRVVRATPVGSPLTRTKRCGEAGNPCDLVLNQANGGAGNNSGIGGHGGNVDNQGVA